MLHLSQAQLTSLSSCPRKFQHLYFDRLGFPAAPEQQAKQAWGIQFHIRMQQRQLGIQPIAVDQTDRLQQFVEAMVAAAPEILSDDRLLLRQSEHMRTLAIDRCLLTVVYDLLILYPDAAQILDWKTYAKPQNSRWLAQSWQTRLYLYLLAETSDYLPEQLTMTYWFIDAAETVPQPRSIRFAYSTAQHQQTQQDLSQLLSQLQQWHDRYQLGEALPQVAETVGICGDCPFALKCQRYGEPSSTPSFADIEEVML